MVIFGKHGLKKVNLLVLEILPTTNQIGNAQLDKANQYYLGNNLNKDYSKALELYKKAASNGIDEANFSLGLMHHYGKGKLVSYEEAYDYYYKSAINNNPEAQFNLRLDGKIWAG